MSETPNFKKPALVFALIYLASYALFAAYAALKASPSWCGCFIHLLPIMGWPALLTGIIGLSVTAIRWHIRIDDTRFSCLTALMIVPATLICSAAGLFHATDSVGSPFVFVSSTVTSYIIEIAIAGAAVLSLALAVSLLRERQKKDLPVARTVD